MVEYQIKFLGTTATRSALPNTTEEYPFISIGDGAFALHPFYEAIPHKKKKKKKEEIYSYDKQTL